MPGDFSRILRLIIIFLTFFFWPFNFFLHNPITDTIHFFLPSLLLFSGIIIFKDFLTGQVIALGLIPILNTSLLFVPILTFLYSSNKRRFFIAGLVVVFTIFLAWRPFLGGSIFYFSHDDQQKIIRQGYLYPSVFLARTFQNKPSIFIDRFLANFFAITDLNNYFFGFHPREIAIENQNLQKFPFFSLLFFLVGLYCAARYKKAVLIGLLIVIINLALLKNFDKTDGILWVPLMYLIVLGLFKFMQISKKVTVPFLVLTVIFSSIEYLHIVINYLTRG